MNLKVSYDAKLDYLDLSEGDLSADVIEIYPGVNVDLDADGALICVEVWGRARKVLGPAIEPLLSGDGVFDLPLNGSLADLDAQLRPSYGQDYQDYMEAWPDLLENDPEAVKALETLRSGIAALLEQVKAGTTIS